MKKLYKICLVSVSSLLLVAPSLHAEEPGLLDKIEDFIEKEIEKELLEYFIEEAFEKIIEDLLRSPEEELIEEIRQYCIDNPEQCTGLVRPGDDFDKAMEQLNDKTLEELEKILKGLQGYGVTGPNEKKDEAGTEEEKETGECKESKADGLSDDGGDGINSCIGLDKEECLKMGTACTWVSDKQ